MRRLKSRRRKRNDKIKFMIISALLLIVVFVSATGYAYFKQGLKLTGSAKIGSADDKCSIHNFSGYKLIDTDIAYTVYDNKKGTNLHVTITLTNTGTKKVDAWRAFIQLPEGAEITNFYNTNQVSTDSYEVFENPSQYYNNIISGTTTSRIDISYKTPGADYQIKDIQVYGFDTTIESIPSVDKQTSSCVGGGTTDPDKPNPDPDPDKPNPDPDNPDPDDPNPPKPEENVIAATYTKGNSWQSGNNTISEIKITISNNSAAAVDNWYVIVDVGEGGKMSGCWNATCSTTGSEVKITAPVWKASIPANDSITISFQVTTAPGQNITIVEAGRLS